jgi:hypothetical protein
VLAGLVSTNVSFVSKFPNCDTRTAVGVVEKSRRGAR